MRVTDYGLWFVIRGNEGNLIWAKERRETACDIYFHGLRVGSSYFRNYSELWIHTPSLENIGVKIKLETPGEICESFWEISAEYNLSDSDFEEIL